MACKQHLSNTLKKQNANSGVPTPSEEQRLSLYLTNFLQNLPPRLFEIRQALVQQGAQVYLVGGVNRDLYRGFLQGLPAEQIKPKDIDVEVHHLSMDDMVATLHHFGKVAVADKRFVVANLTTPDKKTMDFSIARKERFAAEVSCQKCGATFSYNDLTTEQRNQRYCPQCGAQNATVTQGNRKAYEIETGEMSIEDACRRRDFGMNAMLLDFNPEAPAILDPFQGKEDLKNNVINIVDLNTFPEDPLRFFRLSRQAAQLKMKIDKRGVSLARHFVSRIAYLPADQIANEWHKMLAQGKQLTPSFSYLLQSGWLTNIDPSEQSIILAQTERLDQFLNGEVALKHQTNLLKAVPHGEQLSEQADLREGWLAAIIFANTNQTNYNKITHSQKKDTIHYFEKIAHYLQNKPIQRAEVLSILKDIAPYQMADLQAAREILQLPAFEPAALELAAHYHNQAPKPFWNGDQIKEHLLAKYQIGIFEKKNRVAGAERYMSEKDFGKVIKTLFQRQLQGDFLSETEVAAQIQEILSDFEMINWWSPK